MFRGLLFDSRLKLHTRNVHEKTKPVYLCDLCAKKFNQKQTFELHMFKKHGKVNAQNSRRQIQACQFCGYQTFSGNSMKCHIRNMHTVDNYPCDVCGQVFKKYKQKTYHMSKAHGETKTYMCSSCGYKTMTSRQLKQHMACKHLHENITCATCSYRATSAAHLKEHIAERHPVGAPVPERFPFPCQHCSDKFRTKYRMLTHIFHRHGLNPENKAVLECDQCQYKFICKSMLKKHIDDKHGRDAEPCHVCGKVFNAKSHLKNHIQRCHPVAKKNQCELCEYVTDSNGHFKLHMARKHEGQKHKCNQCNYYSFYQHCFTRHMAEVHGEKDVEVLPLKPRHLIQTMVPFKGLAKVVDASPSVVTLSNQEADQTRLNVITLEVDESHLQPHSSRGANIASVQSFCGSQLEVDGSHLEVEQLSTTQELHIITQSSLNSHIEMVSPPTPQSSTPPHPSQNSMAHQPITGTAEVTKGQIKVISELSHPPQLLMTASQRQQLLMTSSGHGSQTFPTTSGEDITLPIITPANPLMGFNPANYFDPNRHTGY